MNVNVHERYCGITHIKKASAYHEKDIEYLEGIANDNCELLFCIDVVGWTDFLTLYKIRDMQAFLELESEIRKECQLSTGVKWDPVDVSSVCGYAHEEEGESVFKKFADDTWEYWKQTSAIKNLAVVFIKINCNSIDKMGTDYDIIKNALLKDKDIKNILFVRSLGWQDNILFVPYKDLKSCIGTLWEIRAKTGVKENPLIFNTTTITGYPLKWVDYDLKSTSL
jgi:hypothetical protein